MGKKRKKGGYSRVEKDWMGNKIIQKYDENGRKVGYVKQEENLVGRRIAQHFTQDGKKNGYSEKKENIFGRSHRQYYSQDGKKRGFSEKETNVLGRTTTRHFSEDRKLKAFSEREVGLFFGKYLQKYVLFPDPCAKVTESQKKRQKEYTRSITKDLFKREVTDDELDELIESAKARASSEKIINVVIGGKSFNKTYYGGESDEMSYDDLILDVIQGDRDNKEDSTSQVVGNIIVAASVLGVLGLFALAAGIASLGDEND